MKIIGIDPGLQKTGWGIIEVDGNAITHVANGTVRSTARKDIADRLLELHAGLTGVLQAWQPFEAAVEETFVNRNPASALRLGYARGIALMTPAAAGLTVAEYPANLVKKSVVGAGHADKNQIAMMVKTILPGVELDSEDAADALAVAICHAHHRTTHEKLGGKMSGAAR